MHSWGFSLRLVGIFFLLWVELGFGIVLIFVLGFLQTCLFVVVVVVVDFVPNIKLLHVCKL